MTQWKVSLSNGESYTEGVAPFEIIKGEVLPWKRLIKYVTENNLKITSLSLIGAGNTYNLPSAGKNPKFRAFDLHEKPQDFNHFRMLGIENSKNNDLYAVAEAVYTNYKLQLWVDENNPKNCWVLAV